METSLFSDAVLFTAGMTGLSCSSFFLGYFIGKGYAQFLHEAPTHEIIASNNQSKVMANYPAMPRVIKALLDDINELKKIITELEAEKEGMHDRYDKFA